jgi:hypothetical protein
MQNPWDQLPKEPIGDRDDTTIFTAVGRALHEWETMEGFLATVFGFLCGARSEGAIRAYGVVASSSGRLDMIIEACACYDGNRRKIAPIPDMIKRVRNFSPRRNEIAHGRVVTYTKDGCEQGYFLVSPFYSSRKTYSKFQVRREIHSTPPTEPIPDSLILGKYAYNSNQITYYGNEFAKLKSEVFRRIIRELGPAP